MEMTAARILRAVGQLQHFSVLLNWQGQFHVRGMLCWSRDTGEDGLALLMVVGVNIGDVIGYHSHFCGKASSADNAE